jgi:hypothetical protein
VLLAIGLMLSPAAAQQEEEDATEEQRRRDEEYLKRYSQQHAQLGEPDPPTTPDDLARVYAERADELIRDRNHHSFQTRHYRLQTDDPRLDVRAAGELLEQFREFFVATRVADGRPQETDEPTRVFLFYSYYKYNQLIGGQFNRQLLRPKGHYGSTLQAMVLHTDSDRPGGLANTLIHEATHQLITDELYAADRDPASWLSEGLATYYEMTWMNADGFQPGRVGGKTVAVLGEGRDRSANEATRQLRVVREALKVAAGSETPLSLRVVSLDQPAEFYGADVTLNYAASWVLIHYLLHGDDDTDARAFRQFVALDAEGRATPQLLFDELGMTGAELDDALRRHLKTIKVR